MSQSDEHAFAPPRRRCVALLDYQSRNRERRSRRAPHHRSRRWRDVALRVGSPATARFLSRSFIGTMMKAAVAQISLMPRRRLSGSRSRCGSTAKPLREAKATIRDLQTKLAHQRLDRDEGAQRADAEQRQRDETMASLRQELEDVRVLHAKTERDRDQAIADAQRAQDQLRQMKADARLKSCA